ncbi:hypothetical protein BVY03_03440 [bacterium K02(2017)]|nr:hypothetical protein BVY03_03440 [bacterium K02(2017)]
MAELDFKINETTYRDLLHYEPGKRGYPTKIMITDKHETPQKIPDKIIGRANSPEGNNKNLVINGFYKLLQKSRDKITAISNFTERFKYEVILNNNGFFSYQIENSEIYCTKSSNGKCDSLSLYLGESLILNWEGQYSMTTVNIDRGAQFSEYDNKGSAEDTRPNMNALFKPFDDHKDLIKRFDDVEHTRSVACATTKIENATKPEVTSKVLKMLKRR